MSPRLLPLLLLGLLGCGFAPPEAARIYVPTETDLTLQYEDPSRAGVDPFQNRVQIRVAGSRLEGNSRQLLLTTSGRFGQTQTPFREKDGGLTLVQGNQEAVLLPEGFPTRIQHWESRDLHFRVLGYAIRQIPGLSLPASQDRLGVWVEVSDAAGPIRRTYYLPGIGEAEAFEPRNGSWVCVNRLVAQGFTDAPTLKK